MIEDIELPDPHHEPDGPASFYSPCAEPCCAHLPTMPPLVLTHPTPEVPVSKQKKTFMLSIVCDVEMTVDMIWPDGDAPECPTSDDVAAVIEECGGLRDVVRDWNLDDGMTLDISDGKTSAMVMR